MLRIHKFYTGVLIILLPLAVFVASAAGIEDIPRITKEEARELIGRPGVTLIDVRYDDSWKKSDMKIAGAVREHPNEISSWIDKYDKDSTIILYCD